MGSGSQTTTSKATIPGELKPLYSAIGDVGTRVAEQPFTPYTGDFVAGVSETSMAAQPYYEQMGALAGLTPAEYQSRIQQNLSGFTTNVVDPALAAAQRQRDISRMQEQSDIARAGAFGNIRRGVVEAESQAAYDIGLNQLTADLMRQGYDQAAAQTMAQMEMGLGAAGAAAGGLQQLGALQQTTEQAALEADYNEFLRQQGYDVGLLSALTGGAAGTAGAIGQSQTSSSRPGFAQILGGIGAAGQALSLFSDRRLKVNIRPAGRRNGISYYTWDWNDTARAIGVEGHPTYGVMADELMQTHPHLVRRGADGYLRVDYAGLNAEAGAAA
jgi:hypothetical protein